ncbi:MAG TPA: glutamate synthase central domain-containing protein, partial [Anaerolineae bacterium]
MYLPDPALLQNSLYEPRAEHDACGIGFVVDVPGRKSNTVLRQALTVLRNLRHRGATGSEPNTGDGAGVLMQLPHAFFQQCCTPLNIALPTPGRYGVGMLFLPPDPTLRRAIEARFAEIIGNEGQRVLGWRTVPVDGASLGATARSRQPVVRQVIVGRGAGVPDEMAFERKLYIIRRMAENAIRYGGMPGGDSFYISSLSYKTIVYKGMLTAPQLEEFYPDLNDPAMATALAMVHSRFSTNTFPSWERAQPFRYIMHNGEINTLRGNINWMHAREPFLETELFSGELAKVMPAIAPDGSDSAMFDNVLELLVLAGRSLPHAMMMMIPEPWSHHESMSAEKKAFYEYHGCLMEPWDGPAAIGFTDGISVGAVLDRNGLRPARYTLTKDGLLVMASETGVLDIPAANVLRKGRLQPGRMLLVDTAQGRLIDDEEIKHTIASAEPYGEWLAANMLDLADLPAPEPAPRRGSPPLWQRQRAFGYTYEDLNLILAPMARDGVEPVGSMGTDTPLAVLSSRPRLLFDYFMELFAQVTNPPVDANREALIVSKELTLGYERNMLKPGPYHARKVRLSSPLLTVAELERLRHIDRAGFKAATVPMVWQPGGAGDEPQPLSRAAAAAEAAVSPDERALVRGLDRLFAAADKAVAQGADILILSDRDVDAGQAPIPALLAVAGLHHHLIRRGIRNRVGLVVESGEPREVHHMALLIGYGAGAICPYLVHETLAEMVAQAALPGLSPAQAVANYNHAAVKGIVKVMSKMGICTIDGYRGAQIFEAVGIARPVIDRYFTDTSSRVGGVGLDVIAAESRQRFEHGFGDRVADPGQLDPGGQYQWRQDGEQ